LFVIRISSFVIYRGLEYSSFSELRLSDLHPDSLPAIPALIFCEQLEQFWSARTPVLSSGEIFWRALFRLEGRVQAAKTRVFQSFTPIDSWGAPFQHPTEAALPSIGISYAQSNPV
jgi:hypothetical protein